MVPLITLVEQWLDSKNWNYEKSASGNTLDSGLRTESATYRFRFIAFPDKNLLMLLFFYPTPVPTAKRSAVAEYLTRINFALDNGNFEMDFDEGDLQFRQSVTALHDSTTKAEIDELFMQAYQKIDLYFQGIMPVLLTDESPKSVLESLWRQEEMES